MYTHLILQTILLTVVFAASPGFISLDIESNKAQLSKRDSPYLPLKSNEFAIFTDLEIGSNKDKVTVAADTGSSILWVMDSQVSCLPHPNGNKNNCKSSGTFTSSKSNTFNKMVNRGLYIQYQDEEGASGIWGNDSVTLGDATVEEFNFGVASYSTSNTGILGLGFPNGTSNDSLPFQLKHQGITNRSAYSVFLNKDDSKKGNILFGAVDHAKYYGDLQTVPIVKSDDTYQRIQVNVSGIDIKFGDYVIPGLGEGTYLLDTGTSFSEFPREYLDVLSKLLNATYEKNISSFVFDDCSRVKEMSFDIKFDGKTISVPLITSSEDGVCYLNFDFVEEREVVEEEEEDDDEEEEDDAIPILGIDVLRSIYFVVDLDDSEVSLAQAKYTNNKDIEVFPPPEVNRTLASRGRSQEEKVSSANLISSIDVLLCLVALFSWIL